MKIKYLKLKNWLLVAMSSLLGVNLGCGKMFVAEYGCPEARYDVKGTVTDEKGHPIAGIGVWQTRDWSDENSETYGEICYTDTTDAEGRYSVTYCGFPKESFQIDFNDIDSIENGSYLDKVVTINTQDVQLTGGDGHWNHGSGTVVKNVSLKEVASE